MVKGSATYHLEVLINLQLIDCLFLPRYIVLKFKITSKLMTSPNFLRKDLSQNAASWSLSLQKETFSLVSLHVRSVNGYTSDSCTILFRVLLFVNFEFCLHIVELLQVQKFNFCRVWQSNPIIELLIVTLMIIACKNCVL